MVRRIFWLVFPGLVMMVVFSSVVFSSEPLPSSIQRTIISSVEQEVRVDIKNQLFAFYKKGELVFWGRICSGKKGMETPKGKFKVLGKAKDYTSKKYKSKMPYSVRFTNDGHFLHQGTIKNKPSSHGCVRLSMEDAKKVFAMVKNNDLVVVD